MSCVVARRMLEWQGSGRLGQAPFAVGVAVLRTRGLLIGALLVFVLSCVVSLLMVLLPRG